MTIPAPLVAELTKAVISLLGKKLSAGKVKKVLGDKAEVSAYIDNCAKIQAAADAGVGFGNPNDPKNWIPPDGVKVIARAESLIVKLAKKILAKIKG